MPRLLLFLGVIAFISIDCGGQSPQSQHPASPALQTVAPAPIETVPVQPPDSPAALSQTAAAYAESMKAQSAPPLYTIRRRVSV